MNRLTTVWLLAVLATPAVADEQKAREEVERELQQLIGKAPTRVKLEYVGLDEPNYALEEAEFELDGVTLKSPPASSLERPAAVLVWQGDAKPGKHTLTARVTYANTVSSVVSDEGGYKWKLAGTVAFELYAGIEVQVKVTASRVANQADVSKRLKLSLPAAPVMLAKLDDGKMPEPIKRPELPDAGTEVAALDPQQQAKADAEAKRLAAAEEKKALLEAARLAKAEAAQAARERSAAKAEARRLAAEEKKRLREEAKAARAEALRKAKEDAERKKHPERFATPEPPAEVDAGEAVAAAEAADAGEAEEVDAGAPVAVAAAEVAPVDAGAAGPEQAAATEEGGAPLLLIGLGGGALVALILVLVARRRASVPKVD